MNTGKQKYRNLAIIVLGTFFMSLLQLPVYAGNLGTSVSHVKPPVKVKLQGVDSWRTLSGNGLALRSLDEIKIGQGGLLELTSEHKDQIKITENSQLDVDLNEEGSSEINLDIGGINFDFNDEANVKRTLKISTSNGIIGVRGTHFSVLHNGSDLTSVAVFEGEVSVSNRDGQSVTVSRGESVRIENASIEQGSNEQGTNNNTSTSSSESGKQASLHETTWDRWGTKQKLQDNLNKKRRIKLKQPGSSPAIDASTPEQTSITELNNRVTELEQQLDRFDQTIEEISPEFDLSTTIDDPTAPEMESVQEQPVDQNLESPREQATGEIKETGLEQETIDSVDQTEKTVTGDQTATDINVEQPSTPTIDNPSEQLQIDDIEIKTEISSPDEISR